MRESAVFNPEKSYPCHGKVKSLNEGEQFITIEIANGVSIKIDRNFVYADASQQQQVQR